MIPRQAKSTVWIRNQIGYFSDNQSFYYLFNVFLERIFSTLLLCNGFENEFSIWVNNKAKCFAFIGWISKRPYGIAYVIH